MSKTNVSGFLLRLFLVSYFAVAQTACADTVLRSGGVSFPKIGRQSSTAGCVRQTDGKIILAATVEGDPGTPQKRIVSVNRFFENGQRDEAFGTHGTTLIDLPNVDADAVALHSQINGKILVTGNAYTATPGSRSDLLAIRLLPDGKLDPSFNQRGWLIEDLSGDHDLVKDFTSDGQGGSLVVGSSLRSHYLVSHRYDFFVARITSDGKLDERFGDSGKSFVRIGTVSEDMGRAVALHSQQGVLLGGLSRHGYYPDLTVVNLGASGRLNTKFGESGASIQRLSEKGSQANSLLVLDDGKILAGGDYWIDGNPPIARPIVMRLSSNGRIDSSFASNGIARIATVGNISSSILVLALQDDKKILGAGVIHSKDKQTGILIVRLLTDGRPDPSFGSAGSVQIELESRSSFVKSMIPLPSGRIMLCGQTLPSSDQAGSSKQIGSFILMLRPDGTLD